MTQERIVHAGYSGTRPTVAELTFRLEAAKEEAATACRKHIKLLGYAKAWADSRGLENEGPHLHALLREIGRWPEVKR